MDELQLIGRIMFVAIFLGSGIGHFAQRANMIPYARVMGAPFPEVSVPGSGLLILVGGLLVLLGFWPDLGALLLIVFLVPTAVIMHPYWKVSDPQEKAVQQAQFTKNIALAGATLILIWAYTTLGEIPYGLGEPLF